MALIPALISFIYIYSITHINSQEGRGCILKTCYSPGQVRINAILDAAGNYLGGCNCGCDPALGDPNSPKYCAPPKTINYNHNTAQGNCACFVEIPNHVAPLQSTTTTQQPIIQHAPVVTNPPVASMAPVTTLNPHHTTEHPEPTYPTGFMGIPIHYLHPPRIITTQPPQSINPAPILITQAPRISTTPRIITQAPVYQPPISVGTSQYPLPAPQYPFQQLPPPTKPPTVYVPPTKQPTLYVPPTKQPTLYVPPTKPPTVYVPPTKQPNNQLYMYHLQSNQLYMYHLQSNLHMHIILHQLQDQLLIYIHHIRQKDQH
eukprot:1079973_1